MEYLTIGDVNVHELPEVAFNVKYVGKIKVDKKTADGAKDATSAVKGREVREIKIHLSWPDIPRLNAMMQPILKNWDPSGPDGGKPFDFSHERQGLDMGDVKAIRAVLLEAATGPDCEPGSGIVTMEYDGGSWSAPTAAAGTGKTPETKDKQASEPGQGQQFGAVPAPTPKDFYQVPTVTP